MISPAHIGNRRRIACFPAVGKSRFAIGAFNAKFNFKARPSKTKRADVCHISTPSPSGWSGPHFRIRPPFSTVFGRTLAEMRCEQNFALVWPLFRANENKGGAKPLLGRGGKTCRKNQSFWSSLQRLALRPAVTRTLNAASRARLSARSVPSSRAATLSPVRPSAAQPVFSVTTSRRSFAAKANLTNYLTATIGACLGGLSLCAPARAQGDGHV